MKIGLIAQEYFPEQARGGIGTQTHLKARGLARQGHQVFIIAKSDDDTRKEFVNGAITEICLPRTHNGFVAQTEIAQWISRSVAVAEELSALQKKTNLDLLDFPEWAAEGYMYLLNRFPSQGPTTVIQLHGPLEMFARKMNWPDMDSEFYKIGTHMEATCVQKADAVYSSSQCSAHWIHTYYGVNKKDIPIIHSGVEVNRFYLPCQINNKRPTVSFVGKIVQNKGVEDLVRAGIVLAAEIPGLLIRIFGRDPGGLKTSLKEIALKAGFPQLLEFPGFVSSEQLPVELSLSDIFAAPSHYEGGPGFVYLEAMAAGLPVIGCSGSGLDEIISHGLNGFLIPPGDVDQLQAVLKILLEEKTYREEIGRNARAFVRREADTNCCLDKLEEFYRTAIENKSTRS